MSTSCLQRFFSSTMQNLSTQSLLLALGMGAQKTIAASAAINWLLKDGVGRIARMTVATNFGQSFDSDLKVASGERRARSEGGH
jgi:glutamate N-acetyltransferase/amino-acid N-acetyltransferase